MSTMTVERLHTEPRIPEDPTRDRNAWLDELCGYLTGMIIGDAARRLLASETFTDDAAVVVLPVWSWTIPGCDVGGKTFDMDGHRIRLPLRLSYECGPILLHRGVDQFISWHGVGLGLIGSGRFTATTSPGGVRAHLLAERDAALPSTITTELEPPDRVRTQLAALQRAGERCRWALREHLEQYVAQQMRNSAERVISEVTDGGRSGVDQIMLDTLVARFMYGDPDQQVQCPLDRILAKATSPSRFTKVDPGRWLVFELRRDTERMVRSHLGDPGIGPKIRRIARRLGPGFTMDELLAEYNETYPRDRLSTGRALSALGTSITPLLSGDYALDETRLRRDEAS